MSEALRGVTEAVASDEWKFLSLRSAHMLRPLARTVEYTKLMFTAIFTEVAEVLMM